MSNENDRPERTAAQLQRKVPGGANEGISTSRSKGAMDRAKEMSSDAASNITGQVKALLDEKVSDGADILRHLASSVHSASEDLHQNAPQLAGLVNGIADKLESYSDDLREQSVDQLVRAASNYTKRQPAVVFGIAAVVGFFALRTIKSAQSRPVASRPVNRPPQAGGFNGS